MIRPASLSHHRPHAMTVVAVRAVAALSWVGSPGAGNDAGKGERTRAMLEYRRSCERCGSALTVDDHEVYICSFECTWCAACVATFPGRACPNCGGNLAPRPIRPYFAGSHAPEPQPHSDGLRRLAHSA